MKRRHFLHAGLATIAFLLPPLNSCQPAPSTPLRVGLNVWPGYDPFFLAKQLNYYQGKAIELHDYPSSTEISQALRNGDIEVAGLTMDETLLLGQTNPDIHVILITDFSNGADVLLAKPSLKTLPALKGHKIGVESSALGGYVLTRILDKAGLSLKDIQVVSLGVSEHEQAYRQNLVDAVVTFEPVRSKLLQQGARILFDSTQIPKEIVDVLVTHKDTLTQHSAELQALLQGWFRALDYNQQQPQDAAQRMAVREQLSPAQFINSLKLLVIPDRSLNLQLLSTTDPALLHNTQRLAQVMLDKKLLNHAISVESLLSAQVIQSLP